MSPLLALLHWPDFRRMIANMSDSDTSSEILPKKSLGLHTQIERERDKEPS